VLLVHEAEQKKRFYPAYPGSQSSFTQPVVSSACLLCQLPIFALSHFSLSAIEAEMIVITLDDRRTRWAIYSKMAPFIYISHLQ
jgi:hypothetical protein